MASSALQITGVASAAAIKTRDYTGSTAAAGQAAGISAWVESAIGSAPVIRPLADNRARLELSPAQQKAMRVWLETSVARSVTSTTPPKLETNISETFRPLLYKYALPAALAAFAAGAVATYITMRA